jgi:hypothetical protein
LLLPIERKPTGIFYDFGEGTSAFCLDGGIIQIENDEPRYLMEGSARQPVKENASWRHSP